MKQKILIGGLCLTLTLSLVGCGKPQTQQEQQEPKQEVQQVETINTEAPATTPEVKQLSNEEKQPLSGDALIEYFQLVYDSCDFNRRGNTDQEEAINFEVDVLRLRAENENQLLPSDYADQYRAWRPVDEQQAPVENLTFTDCNETVYATGTVNIRSGPSTDNDKVGSLNTGDSVTRTGIGTGDYSSWSRVKLQDGSEVYVASKYLSTTKPTTQGTSKSATQTQTQTQQTSGSKTPSQPSAKTSVGDFDYYDGHGSYDAYLDAIAKVLPEYSRDELKQKFPDLAKLHTDEDHAARAAAEGRLTH